MPGEITPASEFLVAFVTSEWLFARMDSGMLDEMFFLRKGCRALGTGIRLLTCMNPSMRDEITPVREFLVAFIARERLFAPMNSHVNLQAFFASQNFSAKV